MQLLIILFILCSIPLKALSQSERLNTVEVSAHADENKVIADNVSLTKVSSDTAALLNMTAGVALQSAGGMSSQPVIHGMSNDRVNIKIDGAQITSSCPNHMNPALTYIDPSKVATIETMAGLTPVSQGGDSIGGSIVVKSKEPLFAAEGESLTQKLKLKTYYKSNNENQGASVQYTVASEKTSLSYAGLDEKANNYRRGNGDRLKGTLYNQNNQSLTMARKLDSGITQLKLGRAVVPYQGFVNQYMDLNDNVSNSANLSYKGEIENIIIESSLFHQHTNHYMDKITSQRTGSMPMYTRSDESGLNLKLSFDLNKDHILRVGTDYDRYRLDDWWPAVSGSMMMSPDTFESINNGERDRLGLYAEADSSWSSSVTTNLGLRTDIVKMDTGDVKGYNTTNNLPADQAAFNAQDRSKTDHNYDATFLTNIKFSERLEMELGFARKTRSPNLYERYAWAGSTTNPGTSGAARMDMRMINWAGDGNGYVGDIDLKPEVAHTLSTSFIVHDETSQKWGAKLTPYYTQVENFIDVDLLATNSGVNFLKFANHDILLFGADLSGHSLMFNHDSLGSLKAKMMASYTRGYRKDGMTELYHLMPLHGKIAFEHQLGKWTTDLTTHLVSSKKQVSDLRLEPETAGYALIDLGTSYQLNSMIKIDLGLSNILDHDYALPLGGIDLINSTAAMRNPVAGMGRSINTALSIDFF